MMYILFILICLAQYCLLHEFQQVVKVPTVYSTGKILHYIEMSKILDKGVSYFDHKLKYDESIVVKKFEHLLNMTQDKPSNQVLQQFVTENFIPAANVLETWLPIDWNSKPAFASDVYDSNLRDWIMEVNSQWRYLGRRISEDVRDHSQFYSLLYIPHPFIVPGGIFKEFYYWDSYWIIEGLILSDMYLTSKQMIQNYLYLVNQFGYVPNGGRSYYLGRSQPPYLIPMFNLYYEATKEHDFLENNIDTLETEFQWWKSNRAVIIERNGITYEVFYYGSDIKEPRAEKYYADTINSYNITASDREEFFSNIRSAAESGWDFSSRWFLNKQQRTSNILDVKTKVIAPVCLNALMGYNAKILANLYAKMLNHDKAKYYLDLSHSYNQTISRLFWDEQEGIWLDYNMEAKSLQSGFYPSSLVPLWTGMYGMERNREYTIERVLNYLNRINITGYPGGVPTSFIQSGQQWDMPNGWAPLQHMVILGLHEAGKIDYRAEDLAFKLAKNWILNCFTTYQNSTPPAMFEKYNVMHPGVPGGGGEYTVQQGFGWSNGVVMKLLSIYGHKIKINENPDPFALIVGIILILAAFITMLNYIFRDRCRPYPLSKDEYLLEMSAKTYL